MTVVRITENKKKNCLEICVQGHAEYANEGKDIVCAGISVLVQAIFNGITEVLHHKLSFEIKEGYFYFAVPDKIKKEDKLVGVLLETLILNLQDMEKSYSDYMKVLIEEVQI